MIAIMLDFRVHPQYGMPYGIIQFMKPVRKKPEMRKVTVMLPSDLVASAMKASGVGLTPSIRQGLELVVTASAYETLRQLRGKVKFSVSLKELRGD